MPNPETRERSLKIGRNAIQEHVAFKCPHCQTMLFGRETRCTECRRSLTPPDSVRVVYDCWPLKRMYVRGVIGRVLYNAGLKYYEHWQLGGLMNMGSIDMGRVGGSGDPTFRLLPSSDRQAEHRAEFRRGYDALMINGKGTVFLDYVNAIVLREEDPEAVGRRLTKRTAPSQARAVAIEFLKAGLDRLAEAYNLGK